MSVKTTSCRYAAVRADTRRSQIYGHLRRFGVCALLLVLAGTANCMKKPFFELAGELAMKSNSSLKGHTPTVAGCATRAKYGIFYVRAEVQTGII